MPDQGFELELVEHVRAPREIVFSYLTDPARMAMWIGGPVTSQVRPKGRYRIQMRDGPTAAGEYTEIDPPRRLVFTWGVEGDKSLPPGSTRVEISLTQVGETTTVRLRHFGLPDALAQSLHTEGWTARLAQLAGLTFG
ncbi:MAG: SRPBCC domain-containing protein [Candidatus Dormibacteraeota bacterium]|nr:SRPBCC domain-containing protein [Candidatus Dormibacteraeota bacterium]